MVVAVGLYLIVQNLSKNMTTQHFEYHKVVIYFWNKQGLPQH